MIFRFSYVMKTIELLLRLKDITDITLSVTQCTTVSKCIDFVVTLGFIPCFIPSVWKSFENKHKSVTQLTEDISSHKVIKKVLLI